MSATLMVWVFIALYLLLIWKSGKTFPLVYLFAFTYFLQYVFAPYFVYNQYDVLSYQMPIRQEQYFDYAIPALLSLFLGIFLFMKDFPIREHLRRINRRQATELGYLLVGISLGFDLIGFVGITALSSIGSFTTYLKYLGAFCFLFAPSRFHYLLIGLIYLQLGLKVVEAGVFISFFIWATFLFFFIVLSFRLPFLIRMSAIVIAVPATIMVQSVKNEYREMTWEGPHEGGVELFSELAEKNQEEGPYTESRGFISTIGRLSQGWHLGLALKHVPKREPFADGQEMLNDIISSILPRVIFANKKEVNSQEKFYQYTGHKLRGSTSMSIGILGDFYINFGRNGAFMMLFAFGAVIAKLL
ncbi:MAG: hypothetical protein WEB30_06790, partial [Cyclobacteriaceae bacterium]